MQKNTIFAYYLMIVDMESLKELGIIPVEYSVLESMLGKYAAPRHKIASLEKTGQIVRLKRGQYVVSPKVTGKILSTELIANHIYGPSYVSMESALRYYGLIPESVYATGSMTLKRSRDFENSIGRFDYTQCTSDYYAIGIRQINEKDYSFLIATPEKALCDLIAYTPKLNPRFISSMREFLEEDLRLDMDEFYKMDIDIFRACAEVGKKSAEINNIIKIIRNESI